MIKYLIIGSRGFIGTHVAHYFRKHNHEVFECDVSNEHNNDKYFQVNFSNSNYDKVFTTNQYDYCINCSGASSVKDSFSENLKDFSLNVSNVYKMLDAIKKYQTNCRYINLSSAAVYGNPVKIPIRENDRLQPISPYGLHKHLSEQALSEFSIYFNVPTLSLRIFSAYGQGLQRQLFWDLYKRMKNSDNIELFGTGNETRDFIHVSDIARAIGQICNLISFDGQSLNLASGIQITIREAANTFKKVVGWNGEICFSGSSREGDPFYWQADVSRLKETGFRPTISLEEGLSLYYEWLRRLKSG